MVNCLKGMFRRASPFLMITAQFSGSHPEKDNKKKKVVH